jgi:hyaluronoglucosaminidase
MKYIKNSVFLALMIISSGWHVQAQTSQVFPQPQQMQLTEQRFTPRYAYHVKSESTLDSDAVNLLKRVIKIENSGRLLLVIRKAPTHNELLQRSGAYTMQLTPEKIEIEIADQRSLFYAAQTLWQLAEKKQNAYSFPVGSIIDYPDVAFRGTVEGFYGEPWSHTDRLEQLRFYGKLKLNTYIYGPKDDPYHSSPHWRDAYPEDKAIQLKELVTEAQRNKVDFVWAIHPGKDIQWNKADSVAVINKMEMMYSLGVRSFAVFFDDIAGAGTDAIKQADLLNYIQHHFSSTKKDVLPLIMCPTEYNKSWANKKEGTYLDILGKNLDVAIRIMWTGNRVVGDITKEGLEWVNQRIKRPAFVWWNFPVNDYVRDHLLMGAAYGLDVNAAAGMSGFVSNPMDKAEASKPAIFSVAMYTWNMKSYHPQQAWEAAQQYVMPEAPQAFLLFGKHNSDPGANGHSYRREESTEIEPLIDSFLSAQSRGAYAKQLAAKILSEFAQISNAPAQMKSRSQNKRLIEQITPWLAQFEWLGKAGVAAIKSSDFFNRGNEAMAWEYFLKTKAALDSMASIDQQYNRNPYQPGVKTGSLVLTPFVKEWHTRMGNLLMRGGASQAKDTATATRLLTNAEALMFQPLMKTNNSISIAPVLEVVKLDEDQYIGFRVGKGLKITSLQFNLVSGNLSDWGRFEVSPDGQHWDTITVAEKKGNGTFSSFNENTTHIRFRNGSTNQASFYLKEFRVQVQPVNVADQLLFMHDGSVNTYNSFSNKETLVFKLPQGFKNARLHVFLKTNRSFYTISTVSKNGKKEVLYRGDENFVQIPSSKRKSISQIEFSSHSPQPIDVFEIVPIDKAGSPPQIRSKDTNIFSMQ